ncbi:MAG: hypothetical protein RXR41_01020 [Candidatus Marsarchaeota archaeon]|jgi:ribosomal protein L31E
MPEHKEYLISLRDARFAHGNKKASHAMRMLRQFLKRHLGQEKFIIDPELNSFIWSRGINRAPRLIEVVLDRAKGDEPWVVKLRTGGPEGASAKEAEQKQTAERTSGESVVKGD